MGNNVKAVDGISAKFVTMSANVIGCHLANVSNDIRSMLKQHLQGHHPVSLLGNFSRI